MAVLTRRSFLASLSAIAMAPKAQCVPHFWAKQAVAKAVPVSFDRLMAEMSRHHLVSPRLLGVVHNIE